MDFPGGASERCTNSPRVSPPITNSKASAERNVMMIEALDGVGWSSAYACPVSENCPKNSKYGWTNIATAIPPRWTPRTREAAAS